MVNLIAESEFWKRKYLEERDAKEEERKAKEEERKAKEDERKEKNQIIQNMKNLNIDVNEANKYYESEVRIRVKFSNFFNN